MTRRSAYVTLAAALLLVSTSGPFIVMAAMDPWATVLLRTALAAPLFLGFAWWRGQLRVPAGLRLRLAVGGVLLGAHFLLWVKAFDLTDYASNLLLLVAQPAIAAVLGARLGERATRATWVSVALATLGLAVIAGGDLALGWRAILGDAMSITAGLAIALFYVVTRRARVALPLAPFMGWTLVGCALTALPVVLLTRAPLSYPAAQWGWLAGLVVLTTAAGHGLMNLCAPHVRLFTLNVVIVLEPAIAIAMGAGLFAAHVDAIQVVGGVVLAAAVVIGIRQETRQDPPLGTIE
ncbi:MAG: DMT family transporter [Deltaproteobacteria bacterium]|nr:DMT family transporter [Deltaproteobacteria bacterium]